MVQSVNEKNTHKNGMITFNVLKHAILLCVCLACILPLILVISISVSDMSNLYNTGYKFIPETISFNAYKFIIEDSKDLLASYRTSIMVTVIGGFFSLLFTALIAYPMSRNDYKYKKSLSLYVVFTLLFNGGLVPWYILITQYLKLYDSYLALILPYLVHALYVIILRTFFKSIPTEMIEAAYIDGANEFNIFLRIVLPMSKPALATIGLLVAFRYWNDWWLGMLFINSPEKRPLQYLLYTIMNNIEEMERNFHLYAGMQIGLEDFPKEPARMAMAVLSAGPMLIVFPFFQKYFVKGMTVGAVKG